jgi:hypothetical protein
VVEIIDDGDSIILMISYFDSLEEKVTGSIISTLIDIVEYLKDKIVFGKLDGQMLQMITGKLAESIESDVFQTPNAITGIVTQNSKIAPYGQLLAEGGTVTVRQHTRMNPSGKVSIVRAHPMTFPPRDFMKSALSESQAYIHDRLMMAISEGVSGR